MLGQNNEILSEGWSWEMLRRLWEQVRPDACSRCCLIQSQRLPGSKNNTRGILLGRLKTLKHSKIITCIPYTYHLHIIYIGRDPYISVRGHQIDLWFQNLPILNMTRSIVIIGVFMSMVEEISEFVLCKFPKSVAAEKIKNFNFAIQNVRKGPIQERKCQKCSLPPKPTNRFLFFELDFKVHIRGFVNMIFG